MYPFMCSVLRQLMCPAPFPTAQCLRKPALLIMAGETGGTGRDLPLRSTLIPFPGWDPGGTQYITKWALFTSLGLQLQSKNNCNSCIGGFGPFETLGDPFSRGPPRPSPPPSHLSNNFSSPALNCSLSETADCCFYTLFDPQAFKTL